VVKNKNVKDIFLSRIWRQWSIKVITKLPNSEQSYKGKVKTHKYINRQNQSTTGKLWKGYINGRNSANLELLIDKASSIYLYVKLKALGSWIFLSFTSFWRNSDSYEYTNSPHHFWNYTSNLTTVVNLVLKFMISETTSILKS
jgi:hypothetical protein